LLGEPNCKRDGWSDKTAHFGAKSLGPAAMAMDLGGEQNPWKNRVSMPGNGLRHYGLVGGATP
jgi:hypothetical protein